MLNGLFFAALIAYFVATVLELGGMVFKKEKITRFAWWLFVAGALCNTIYLVARGVIAQRLPLSNQFEFATYYIDNNHLKIIFLQQQHLYQYHNHNYNIHLHYLYHYILK